MNTQTRCRRINEVNILIMDIEKIKDYVKDDIAQKMIHKFIKKLSRRSKEMEKGFKIICDKMIDKEMVVN